MIFEEFPLGGLGKFLVYRGAQKSKQGAEDIDKFCKTLMEKIIKTNHILHKTFPVCIIMAFLATLVVVSIHTKCTGCEANLVPNLCIKLERKI